MPTINDIAKLAGVSHGTVSNVINGRGNVSVEKINLVWQAAEQLGYKINTQAKSLRQGKDRSIAILLPSIEFEPFAVMYEVFQREFMQNGYSVQLYSTDSLESLEMKGLIEALNSRVSAIVSFSCMLDPAEKYHELEPDLPIVLIRNNGKSYKNILYASFDYELAGREIAAYVQSHFGKKIGLFTEPTLMPDMAQFLRGFQSTYQEFDQSVKLVDCPNHQIGLRAFDFFDAGVEYDYIVCTDRKRETAVKAAYEYSSDSKMPKLLSISPRQAITIPNMPVYELDYKKLAHRIVKNLLVSLDQNKELDNELHISNTGFRKNTLTKTKLAANQLRMLTYESPSTSALIKLIPFLEKSTNIHLELTVLPSLQDVYKVLQSSSKSRYDLIRMDVAWSDELAKETFKPLDEINFNWDYLLSNIIPELGENYTSINGRRYAIPYDPSIQLLFYRKDLFLDPTYKRMYFESFKENLDVPSSFEEYNKIAKFFTKKYNQNSPIEYGSTVAIGNVSVSPSEFMPRLFECDGSILDKNGKITINTPQALTALKNYQQTYDFSDSTVYDSWENVLEGFAEGSSAMTIVFINHASHILNLKMSKIAGKLGFATVPGQKPLLGGGIIGITKECTCPETACEFLSWLYSDLVAPVFTMLGGLSPCKSSYTNRDINEKYPWLSTARRGFPQAQRRGNSTYYKNYSELQFENILALNIRKVLLGECSAEEALSQAQSQCDEYFEKA